MSTWGFDRAQAAYDVDYPAYLEDDDPTCPDCGHWINSRGQCPCPED